MSILQHIKQINVDNTTYKIIKITNIKVHHEPNLMRGTNAYA